MENMVFCQSCGMPLSEEVKGTEANGGKSGDYCHYCYKDGAFTSAQTMEQMIETCIPFSRQSFPGKSDEELRADMIGWFPTLKRWKK